MLQRKTYISLILGCLFSLIWVFFIHSRAYSVNDASRIASIDSLVHRSTWRIDQSPFGQTIDRIKVEDAFYSDKPPMLSFLGAGVYFIINRTTGITLQADGCNPDALPTHCRAMLEWQTADYAYFLLTFLLVSSSATLILLLLFWLGEQYQLSKRWNIVLVFAIGLGTAIFPYSTIFTNHVPSALGLLLPLYLFLAYPNLNNKQLALAGFSVTLSVTIDLSAGLFAIAYLGYVIWHYKQQSFWFIAGCLPPAFLFMFLNYQIVGNPFPPQLYAEGYQYEGSPLYGNISGFSQSNNVLLYAFDMLIGNWGVLLFYPILFWFVYALYRATKQTHLKQLAYLVLVTTCLYILYFVLATDNFGGFAYSPRWLLNPVALWAVFAFIQPTLYQKKYTNALVVVLALFSIISTYRGALNPWSQKYPIIRLVYTEPEPLQLIPFSLSGYGSYEEADPFLRAGFEPNRVIRRWFDARSGFVIPNEPGWWMLHHSTPLAPELTAITGIELQTNTLAKWHLRPQAEAWVEQSAKTTSYISSALIPTQPLQTTHLPITLVGDDGNMALLGYEWSYAPDQITLLTGWQILTRSHAPPQDRRLFVHLLNEQGEIVSQQDLLSFDYATLYPEDMFFQIHHLPLANLPKGQYWLQLGAYYPATGTRLQTDTAIDRALLIPIDIE